MSQSSSSSSSSSSAFSPDLRAALVAMVRKRVPESEVEDIVQATLTEAIESPHAPRESEALRKWIFGVAKNKVVDYHRRAGRESFDMPEVAGGPAPHVEADLLRWAERQLPEGEENKKTLDWMLREGDGEKLESIAASEKLPAPRVRQRVSRLRRHFKENWRREVALLAALGVVISVLAIMLLKKKDPEIAIEPVDPRAEPMRKGALEKCAAHDYKACVEGLDEAKRLDPAGDSRPEVKQAREEADKALKAPPAPSATPSSNLTPPPEPTSFKDDLSPPAKAFDKAEATSKIATPTPPPTASGFASAAPIPTPAPKPMNAKPQATDISSDFIDSDFGSSGGSGTGITKEAPTKAPAPIQKPIGKKGSSK